MDATCPDSADGKHNSVFDHNDPGKGVTVTVMKCTRCQQLLFGIDIFEHGDWEPGRYELRKDDEVIKEGTLP